MHIICCNCFQGQSAYRRHHEVGSWRKMVYKYGGSGATFNNLDATPMLLGRAKKGAKDAEMKELDMGRSASIVVV